MNKTQYIAIRSVLDTKIARYPDETDALVLILDMLIDHPDYYKEEEKRALLERASIISPSILTGTATHKVASKEIVVAIDGSLGKAFAARAIAEIVGRSTENERIDIHKRLWNITRTGE